MKVRGNNNFYKQLEESETYLSEPYVFITKWGSYGMENGQFSGSLVADESTFIITDKVIEAVKSEIWYKITEATLKELPLFHHQKKEKTSSM